MMTYRIPPGRVTRVSELMRAPGKKAKASVTISRGLLDAADDVVGAAGRSALFERAVRVYLHRLVRRARRERELALLNTHASRLNAAAERALADQADLDDG
jgi:metal-responsive CopG/Arc/MetJ family transcriptional regulator